MKRKQVALVVLVLLSIGTAIGVYAGTVGVNNLFGFDNITADVEYYRNGVNYTQFIASRFGSDQSLNTTDGVTFADVTAGEYFLNAVNKTDILAYPYNEADYIIRFDGTNYNAINGTTGIADYSGINNVTVIQNAINALSSGTIYLSNIELPFGLTWKNGVNFVEELNGVVSNYGPNVHGSLNTFPIYDPRNTIQVINDFETAWAGGTLNDTRVKSGNYSNSLTSVNNGVIQITKGALGLDLSGRDIYFQLYIDDRANVSTVQIIFATDGTFNDAAQEEFAIRVITGWNEISIAQGEFGYGGAFSDSSWSTINNIAFNVRSQVGTTVIAYIDNLCSVKQEKLGGRVSFNFDDGHERVYTQYKPALDLYGYKANTFATKDWVGTANFMTEAQLQELDSQEWDVGSHSVTHTSWGGASLNDRELELARSQKYLIDLGITKGARFFAAPGFDMDGDTLDIAKKYYLGVRYKTNNIESTYPPRYQLNDYYDSTPTLAESQTQIDRAIETNGWVVFHLYDYPAWFVNLTQYIFDNEVDVVTYSDVFDGELEKYSVNFISENSGNATLAAVTSSITVSHGVSYTPTLGDIQVTASRNLGNCTYYWYDNVTATQFTIRVGATGAEKNIDQTVYFLWSVNPHN